ncbi:MAG: hypothetical protein QG622_2155 [Actinomycetota bacterium]|nr:hypothetical protein [Actinomycetota bacterium]
MTELVRVPLKGGGSVLIEDSEPSAHGPVRVGRVGDVIKDATDSLQGMLTPVRETAQAVLDELRQARPDEVEVQFGVTLSAVAGAVIAKTTTGAHLTIKVTWRREEDARPDTPSTAQDLSAGGSADTVRP